MGLRSPSVAPNLRHRARGLAPLWIAAAVLAGTVACSSDGGTEKATIDGGSGTGSGTGGDDAPTEVLIVRGASGTGGALAAETGGIPDDPEARADLDDQLSSIADGESEFGFADLTTTLEAEGYAVTEVQEVGGEEETGVDFTGDVLEGVDIVVLASNNGIYGEADVAALVEFVRGGGAILAFEDVNYGQDRSDAAESDSQLMGAFDMAFNQDNTANASVDPADATVADHPILEGVDAPLDTLGVGTVTVLDAQPDIDPIIVLPATGEVRENPPGEQGDLRPSDPTRDAALAVVEVGGGRVAGVWDRDYFFNDDDDPDTDAAIGQGNPATRLFTLQLFDWLAGRR